MSLRPWRDHLPAGGPEPFGADPGPSGTLPAAWSRRWQSDPHARLWLEEAGPGAAGPERRRWWTAGEFDAATRRMAGRLQGAGLRPGDRLVWSTAPSVAALVAHVAALRAGMVVVPANPAYTVRELAHIVADTRPAAAVLDRPDQKDAIVGASDREILVVGPSSDLPDAAAGELDLSGPDDPAVILYTSGTTGAPKGAVLRHRNLFAGAESLRIAWRWSPEDRLLHALPIFHAHGLCVAIYGTMLVGSSAVLLPGFDPATVAEAAGTPGASVFFGVPTMYHRLARSGHAAGLRGLRLCVSGSAPMSLELHAAMQDALGATVLERYGMTETLMTLSNPYDGPRRPGTVGFPLPGVEARIGEDGELSVAGPGVLSGYWERPTADADAFTWDDAGKRWFSTGDLAVEDDGYVAIRGRRSELIISGGFNVYPAEVEDVLLRHPSVAEVAVTGTPSEEWGEVVTAWIVADGTPPTVDELARFTEATLAPYKRPRLVRVVDELPRNALGKVLRNHLG